MSLKIGILQMSVDATNWYLKQLQENVFPTIYPTDFDKLNALLPNDTEPLEHLLSEYLECLSDLEYLLVPNITIHKVLDRLFVKYDYGFKLIHPLKLMVKILKSKGIDEVVIFGSYYTMQEGYVSNFFNVYGIRCEFPSVEDCLKIDACRKLIYNDISKAEECGFQVLLESYAEKKPVVLCCTELSIANTSIANNMAIYDMAQAQLAYCLKYN